MGITNLTNIYFTKTVCPAFSAFYNVIVKYNASFKSGKGSMHIQNGSDWKSYDFVEVTPTWNNRKFYNTSVFILSRTVQICGIPHSCYLCEYFVALCKFLRIRNELINYQQCLVNLNEIGIRSDVSFKKIWLQTELSEMVKISHECFYSLLVL